MWRSVVTSPFQSGKICYIGEIPEELPLRSLVLKKFVKYELLHAQDPLRLEETRIKTCFNKNMIAKYLIRHQNFIVCRCRSMFCFRKLFDILCRYQAGRLRLTCLHYFLKTLSTHAEEVTVLQHWLLL